MKLNLQKIHYKPEEFESECAYCGIFSFEHIHEPKTLAKDFIRVEQVKPVHEIIQKIDEEFDEKIIPILENPLYEVHFTEGHEKPKKCTEEDIKLVKQFLHSSINTVLDEAVRVMKHKECSHDSNSHCLEENCYIHQENGYNKAINDTIQLLNEMK